MKFVSTVLIFVLLLTGCMSDKEYYLRKKQLDNQAKHPATFDVLNVQGPIKVEIGSGGTAKVTVPGQPFREIHIPDGVKTQTDLIRHLISVGAISVMGWKALDNVNGERNITTINNGAAAGGAN